MIKEDLEGLGLEKFSLRFNIKFSNLESILDHQSAFAKSIREYLKNKNYIEFSYSEDLSEVVSNDVYDLMQNFRQLIFLLAYSTGI